MTSNIYDLEKEDLAEMVDRYKSISHELVDWGHDVLKYVRRMNRLYLISLFFWFLFGIGVGILIAWRIMN